MRHINCFSFRYLARYIVVIGLLSALAGAQQTLQLNNSGTSCSPFPTPTLTCQWADSTGCVKTVQDIFSPTSLDANCPSNSSISVEISDNGFDQIWQTDSCRSTITVNNGCGSITSAIIDSSTSSIPDGSGGNGCGTGDPVDGGRQPDCSPIIVDTRGEGFHLTSAKDGVLFDIKGDGHPIRIAWTAAGSGNGFLALDRNHNGTIDNGTELFGNFTQQQKSPTPNGFLALAEFDKPENGGNGDGIIDEHDAVFSHLVIWIDENHDGISQPSELHTLTELGIYSLSLQYKESRRVDEFGNLFRYRAKVNPGPNDGVSDAGRWAVDVFLRTSAR